MDDEPQDITQARGLLAEKSYDQAVGELKSYLGQNPDDAAAWRLLAAAHVGLSQWGEAADATGQVVRLSPEDAMAWSTWGLSLRKAGKLAEAEGAQRKALALDPGCAQATSELSELERVRGQAPPPPAAVNNSGMRTGVPDEVKAMGWSWGAFTFTWLWGLSNKVYVALIALLGCIPYVGLLLWLPAAIWLGVRGHSLAWQHRRFDNFDQFRSTMKVWNIWGVAWFFGWFGLMALVVGLFVVYKLTLGRPPVGAMH